MSRRAQGVLVLVALVLLAAAPASAAPAPVATVVIDGVISPVTLRLIESALTRAKAGGAQALVIQLDTPGGLERSMRAICQRLLDGRTVKTSQGPVTLATREAVAKPIEIGFRDRVLAVITDPNVAYVLMMLGTLGLIFELSTPGAVLPGVIGGISLILAFFAFQSLPINFAGLLLILFAIVLFIAEVKVTSHGVLAVGGIVAMALGSLMLYDAPEVGFRVSWRVLVPTVALTAGFFLFALTLGMSAFRQRPLLDGAGLVGRIAGARGPLTPEGAVAVAGELWRAVAERPLPDGARVKVVDVQGLTLRVVAEDAPGGGTR